MFIRSLLLSYAVILILYSFPAYSEQPDEVRIGLIASLTGPAAEQGTSWMRGAMLAAENVDFKGKKIVLKVEDDQTQALEAVSAFHRLKDSWHAEYIIGGTWDFLAQALYPLAETYQVPFLTPTNPPEMVLRSVGTESPWVLTNGLSLTAEMEAMKRLLRATKKTRIAVVAPDLDWGRTHAHILRLAADNTGAKVVSEEFFPYETYLESVKSALLRAVKEKPDLLYSPVDASGILVLVRESMKRKLSLPILTTQHVHSLARVDTNFKKNFSLYREVVGIYPSAEDLAFNKSYKNKYGQLPEVYAEAGFDLVSFVAALSGSEQIGKRVPLSQSMKGLQGEYQLPAKGPQIVETKAVLMRLDQDGQLVSAEGNNSRD